MKIIEGVFDAAQKREIIERLTETMVEIEGENMRQVTWCVVEEVKSGDWGIAGNPLSDRAGARARRGSRVTRRRSAPGAAPAGARSLRHTRRR